MSTSHRLLYNLVVVLLGLAAFIAASIVCLSLAVSIFVIGEPHNDGGWLFGPVLLLPLVIATCWWTIAKRLRWRWLGFAALLIVATFISLAHDDSAPPTLPDLGPRVGTDDPGYQTVMWFAEKSPYCRLHEPGAPDPEAVKLRLPEDREAWAAHIAKNSEAIFTAARANTIGRDWIVALDHQPPSGIFPQVRLDVYLDFKPMRATVEMALACAYVLALDGRRDEAICAILPSLAAMHNLQRTGTTLLNVMIGQVLAKRCYLVLDAILQLGPITGETNDLLIATLEKAPPARQLCRNALLGEADFVRLVFESLRNNRYQETPLTSKAHRIGVCLAIGGPFVFNPNRTERRIGAILAQICTSAEARNLPAMDDWQLDWGNESQLKNPVGRMLAGMIIPAFSKPVKMLWATDDLRLALLQKCSGAASTPPPISSPGHVDADSADKQNP